MDEVKNNDREIEYLKSKNEVEDQKLSLEQKRALTRRMKKEYGTDWKKILLGAAHSVRVDTETLQTLHSMGTSGERLRELNTPRSRR